LCDGKEAGKQGMTSINYVTPEYFNALQIPILTGRPFADSDGPDSQRVAIVNRTFVGKFFHRANPVGRYLRIDDANKPRMIIGVVGDVAIVPGLDSAAPLSGEEGVYIPAAQVEARPLALAHVWFQP